jgi:mannosyltransferase
MSGEFDDKALDALEVIIPNLNWRYSGGTAVNRTIAPLIAKRWRTAWCGPDQPEGIAALSLRDLVRLRFRPPSHGKVRIWHARRNVEMLAGLFLNLIGYRFALIFNSASQRKKTWLTHFLIARMDALIATSQIAAQFLRRPATVILHGIDVDLYSPPPDRLAAFAEASLPGKYGIGTFGRVRRQKGSDLFVEAMCRLLPKYSDFCAVVVGLTTVDNLPFVEGLKQQIAAAGLTERIRFLGELPIEEVPLWYQRISIYVFASRVEGFGLTMLEAMAAGDAVVATRAGAAEMIISDEDDGILVPVDDVDALVAALEPLMREPERIEAMGRRARARVVSAFSRDREADEISDVYRRVWGSKAP